MRSIRYTFVILLAFALSLTFVSALTDVAYIYKSGANVEQTILDIFEDHGLSYELVSSRDLPLQTSNYRSVFIGDERFTDSDLPLNLPTIITTRYHGIHFRIVDVDGISQLSSSSPLKVLINDQNKKVYTATKDNFGKPLAYYYLESNNIAQNMVPIAAPYETGSGEAYGSVVSFASAGDELHLGRVLQEDLCYFGIPDGQFWTPFAKDLFSDCVDHVIMPLSDTGEESEEPVEETGECSLDSDCDDSDPATEDSCTFPGSASSTCEHALIVNPLFSSLTSSSNLNSITVFFSLFDPSSATGLNIKINDDNWTSINTNSTNYTFENLSSGAEYTVTLQVSPSQETESLTVSTSSPVVDNSGSSSGGGSGGGSSSSNAKKGGGTAFCSTEWSCTDWSECENGQQNRECSYPENYCEPQKDKPEESRVCVEDLSFNTGDPNIINQADSTNPSEESNPQSSSSPITGAVIGALEQRPTLWIIAFLLIVIALYIYVNSAKK